jgi:pimeloyl-ACP methyl ester carboxylesterase
VTIETLELPTADGGVLSVEAAAGDGVALLVHTGSPGSRLLDHTFIEHAARSGFRLVSYDRPGYGRSSPHPGRRVAQAASEIELIADALELERMAVWGFSGGGPFALACAALVPDRVSATSVFATIVPWDEHRGSLAAGVSPGYQEEIELYLADPLAYRARFRIDALAAFSELSRAETWLQRWGQSAGTDEAHSRDLAVRLAANVCEAARQDDEGWWEDWVAYHSPWGFEPGAVHGPLQLWHGEADPAVPVSHGRWLATQLPHAEAQILAQDDHATIEIDHRAEALTWLTERI